MTIKYYKIDDKLFKVLRYNNYENNCQYVYRRGWVCELWRNPSFLTPNINLMEIIEKQMNIEVGKLKMMKELRK